MSSAFPSRPKLSAIVQQATLKREGLVADCIFPQVKTDCKFDYIDWSNEVNGQRIVNDLLGCKTDVHEVDAEPYTLVTKSLGDYGLAQSLGECCVTSCGTDTNALIEAGKTRQLLNKLLVAHEARAIALATGTGNYTDNLTKVPGDSTAVYDGGLFNLDSDDLVNANFGLLRWFQAINENVQYGARNVMVTDQATLNKIMAHPNFIGSGCVVDPMSTPAKVAALLGLQKICIADANYNDGLGSTPSIKKLWPANTILFTRSYEFVTSADEQFAFGIGAYNRGFGQYNWLEGSKGPQDGVVMQKITHDITPTVLSYKAATLVKIFED